MKRLTQEDKELLLKDLCARLPHDVMLNISINKYTDKTFNAIISAIDYCGEVKVRYGFEEYEQAYPLEQIKPYLFPMSSMTEEQRKEYEITTIKDGILTVWTTETYDWLNKNHFDYRGLIPKGIANDATGLGIY